MSELLGMPVSKGIKENIVKELEELKKDSDKFKRNPKLAIVRVGEREDDVAYEKGAVKKIEGMGMECECITFSKDILDEDFRKSLKQVSDRDDIDGILMFAPLPKQIDEAKATECINPKKDLDGLTLSNQAKLYAGCKDGFAPCTAEAVIRIIKSADVQLAGANVVVIGRSTVIGKPVSMLLISENATVTVCHSHTKDLKKVCKQADVLIAAIGKAEMIDSSYVKEGAVVIDVGINVDKDGTLCGDVDYEDVEKTASLITPVPRGVGSVTTSILAEHLLRAFKQED